MKSTFSGLLLTLVLAVAPFASAKNNPVVTQFGHDIRIAPDQKTGDLTCIGCSIYVRGEVAGDVTAVGGSVILEGDASIAGDVTTVGGNLRAGNGTKIAGDLTAVGGKVYRQPEAEVAGDVTALDGQGWMLLIFGLPLLIFAGIVAFIVWLVQPRRPVQPLARAA
jgi:phage baseplate assembly protein gpV